MAKAMPAWAILLVIALVMPLAPAAAAQETGSISGVLTDADTGEPIANEYVAASSRDSWGATMSRSDGTYAITGLSPGDYRVATGNGVEMTESDYVFVYWQDAQSYYDADLITVVAGQDTAGIDFALQFGGVITGTVTDAWSGAPIGSTWISASRNENGQWMGGVGTPVADDGTFRMRGLSGEYRLEFWETDYQAWESPPFVIEPGQQVEMDVVATPAYGTPFATVTGRVCEQTTSGTGCFDGFDAEAGALPSAGVTVEARNASGTLLGTTTTDQWGWFNLEQLAPGEIVVSAQAPSGFTLVEPASYTLGPNEAVWEAELRLDRVDVQYVLSSRVEPDDITMDEQAELTLTLRFVGAAGDIPFDVTNVVVDVHLPAGLRYLDHTGDGPFSPDTGLWTVPVLPYLEQAEMVITIGATEERRFLIHAEIASADWPDEDVTFGDGRGLDHTGTTLSVTAAPAIPPPPSPAEEPVVDAAVIAGTVWSDLDTDGEQASSEPGVAGVRVIATDTAAVTVTTVTADDGTFRIESLPAGTYRLALDPETLPPELEAPPVLPIISLLGDTVVEGVDFGCLEMAAPFRWLPVIGIVAALAVAGMAAWLLLRRRRRVDGEPEDAMAEPDGAPMTDSGATDEREVDRIPL